MATRTIACMFISVSFPFIMLSSSISRGAESKETRLDAAGIERDAQMVNLRLDRQKNAIILDDTELVEDDAPAVGVPEEFGEESKDWIEFLQKGTVIKKVFLLDNPAANSGRLLFEGGEANGNKESLHISLNGVEYIRPATRLSYPFAKQYTDFYLSGDRWFYIDLPVGALKKGENEVLLWANGDSPSWHIHIAVEKEFARGSLTRTHHPNRSMKSLDGGKTWSDNKLGSKNGVDGEYCVRLSLDRHVKSGQYVSPVIDIVSPESALKRAVKVDRIKYAIGIETPKETTAAVLTRFGSSPRPDDSSWTKWDVAESGKELTGLGNRRYFQWKVDFSTANPLKTPKLKDFALVADYDDLSPNKGQGVAVDVVHNGHVSRSSYAFQYENLLHPGLVEFRKNAELDKLCKGASGEFEVMMRLLNWAYHTPLTNDHYTWDWNKVVKNEKGKDGKPSIVQHKGRLRNVMCLYSSQVLTGALLSMGYQARHINIHSEMECGHEVTEAWSNEFNKWFYMDATRDYYYFDAKTGAPLNTLEIHNLVAERMPRAEAWQRPLSSELGMEIFRQIPIGIRQGVNQFDINPDGRYILRTMGHFRIIPRNDFLTNPLPVPVHTGASMWGWNGFLDHYDAKFPKRYEYQRQTDRGSDFYEPLNQAEVYLNETSKRGVLNVEVNTFTPGFETFLVRLNEGDWVEQKQPVWSWTLRAGNNFLDVRVRTVRGVLGPVSTLHVAYNP